MQASGSDKKYRPVFSFFRKNSFQTPSEYTSDGSLFALKCTYFEKFCIYMLQYKKKCDKIKSNPHITENGQKEFRISGSVTFRKAEKNRYAGRNRAQRQEKYYVENS